MREGKKDWTPVKSPPGSNKKWSGRKSKMASTSDAAAVSILGSNALMSPPSASKESSGTSSRTKIEKGKLRGGISRNDEYGSIFEDNLRKESHDSNEEMDFNDNADSNSSDDSDESFRITTKYDSIPSKRIGSKERVRKSTLNTRTPIKPLIKESPTTKCIRRRLKSRQSPKKISLSEKDTDDEYKLSDSSENDVDPNPEHMIKKGVTLVVPKDGMSNECSSDEEESFEQRRLKRRQLAQKAEEEIEKEMTKQVNRVTTENGPKTNLKLSANYSTVDLDDMTTKESDQRLSECGPSESSYTQENISTSLLIRNAFDKNFVGTGWKEGRKEELRESCSQFGNVINMNIIEKGEELFLGIKFENKESAKVCYNNMNGQYFYKQRLEISYVEDEVVVPSLKLDKIDQCEKTISQDKSNSLYEVYLDHPASEPNTMKSYSKDVCYDERKRECLNNSNEHLIQLLLGVIKNSGDSNIDVNRLYELIGSGNKNSLVGISDKIDANMAKTQVEIPTIHSLQYISPEKVKRLIENTKSSSNIKENDLFSKYSPQQSTISSDLSVAIQKNDLMHDKTKESKQSKNAMNRELDPIESSESTLNHKSTAPSKIEYNAALLDYSTSNKNCKICFPRVESSLMTCLPDQFFRYILEKEGAQAQAIDVNQINIVPPNFPRVSSGTLVISAGVEKLLTKVKDRSLLQMCVLCCDENSPLVIKCISTKLGQKCEQDESNTSISFTVCVGDSFYIPPGCFYSILNEGDVEGRIFFSLIEDEETKEI